MGAEISCEQYSINTSRASRMAVLMCSEKFDEQRDTDGEHHQTQVHASALKHCDETWPVEREALFERFNQHVSWYESELERYTKNDWDLRYFNKDWRDDLLIARAFITNAASTGEDAHYSH